MIEKLMADAGLSCVIFLMITLCLKLVLIISDDALEHSSKSSLTQVFLIISLLTLGLAELFMIIVLMLQLDIIVVATLVLCIKFLNYKVK